MFGQQPACGEKTVCPQGRPILIRGWQTMRWRAVWLAAVGCVAMSTGCLTMPSVRENERISQRIRKDMIDFYENMAQAYYLLGYEYYKLYREATDAKNDQAAKQYLNNARLYKQYYDDLIASINVMRRNFGLPASEAKAQAFSASAPTRSEDEPTTSRTVVVPVEPAAQKAPKEDRGGVRPEGGAAVPPTPFDGQAPERKPGLLGRIRSLVRRPQPAESK